MHLKLNSLFAILISLNSFTFIWADILPAWVEDISTECETRKEMCAIGEGPSLTSAENSAKVNLAQIFQTQIKSKMESYKHSWQKDFDQGSVLEQFSEEQSLITDEVLEGVRIKRSAQRDDSHYFALATLNRKILSAVWEKEMDRLDENMLRLLEDSLKSSVIKLKKDFIKREKINLRYHVLNEQFYPNKITHQMVQNKEKLVRPSEIMLVFNSDESAKMMAEYLNKVFLDNGYSLKKSNNSKYKVVVKIESKKLYLKVEGFEKYQIQISLVSYFENTKKLGSIVKEISEQGRDLTQIQEKVVPEFKEYIKEHIAELNIP